MPSLIAVSAIAGLSGLALANPVKIDKRSTFSIKQVPVSRSGSFPHPAQQMVRIYNKYGASQTIPEDVTRVAAAAETGEVSATPVQNDSEYLCPVQVGQNNMNLDFDTGSADLWVFSDLQDSSETSGHNVYSTSSGQQEQGESWSISYGDGSSASGEVFADTVVIGGVTATSQAVEAATSVSSSFVQNPNDGLVGLAFSSINTVTPNQATTFFATVASSLEKALFTVRLRKGEAGSYDFGYIDSSKYTGSLAYTDVDNSKGFWGFTPSGYSVGSSQGQNTISSAIADTGTSLLLLDNDIVQEYYSQVQGANYDSGQAGYTFPCSSTLPDFTLQVGQGTVTVPGSYINYVSVDGSTCLGGIQSNSGVNMNIFGDVFLKAAFVVFDNSGSQPQLGFAQGA